MQAPGKVLMFLWRLAHNSLPTRMNIKRKQIELDTLCPMCSRHLHEGGGHIFLKCKAAKAVWREQRMEDVRLQLCECQNSREVVQIICALPHDKQLRTA